MLGILCFAEEFWYWAWQIYALAWFNKSHISFSLSHDILLLRDLIINIIISSSTPFLASIFLLVPWVRDTIFFCDQLISHFLANYIECVSPERALGISIYYIDGQILVLIHANQKILSDIPKDTFMVTQLRNVVWCP
jgi:hypothetical protein